MSSVTEFAYRSKHDLYAQFFPLLLLLLLLFFFFFFVRRPSIHKT